MARTLSLHHLTALDAPPDAFVAIAGELGCPALALFTHAGVDGFPLVTAENEAVVAARLQATGVTLHNVEYVALKPEMAWTPLADAFARSARLGARRMTAHHHDPEEDRALATFARVCALAADHGMRIGLEWTAASPTTGSLAAAERFLALADQPNADLAVDLLHLSRSGGAPADVAALPPGRVGYAQISDGPRVRDPAAYAAHELIHERAPPGEGELPVAAFVAALPRDIVIDVEAPQTAARLAGVSALERARRAVAGARRFVP